MLERISFIDACIDDAPTLLKDIRPEDLTEIVCSGEEPLKIIEESIQNSFFCKAAISEEGQLLAILGVGEYKEDPTVGGPWLIGTVFVEKYKREIVKYGKEFVKEWAKGRRLVNMVHCENKKSIRWLEAIGFTVHPEQVVDVNGHDFYPFHMEAL